MQRGCLSAQNDPVTDLTVHAFRQTELDVYKRQVLKHDADIAAVQRHFGMLQLPDINPRYLNLAFGRDLLTVQQLDQRRFA